MWNLPASSMALMSAQPGVQCKTEFPDAPAEVTYCRGLSRLASTTGCCCQICSISHSLRITGQFLGYPEFLGLSFWTVSCLKKLDSLDLVLLIYVGHEAARPITILPAADIMGPQKRLFVRLTVSYTFLLISSSFPGHFLDNLFSLLRRCFPRAVVVVLQRPYCATV